MKILPLNNFQNKQTFQCTQVKIIDANKATMIIDGNKLGDILVKARYKKRTPYFIVQLFKKGARQLLRAFKVEYQDEAMAITDALTSAKYEAKEAVHSAPPISVDIGEIISNLRNLQPKEAKITA